MKSLLQKPYILILGAIILLGAFLRLYQFGPWLHFELDQSRDAIVIDQGYEGSFLDLPLLGPKAGGTFLRLGPAFYYLQYVSGLVFGENPAGIAFFIPLLSIVTIGIAYLFFRRIFGRSQSLLLTLLFTVSVYVVLYGRFAWNPNVLLFFIPTGFYALLRAVDKDEQYAARWFLGAVAALVLATQFHFLAFLAVPLITLIFLLIKRPRYSWKIWSGAAVIGLFLYLPMILNETKAGFTNTQEFLGAVTEKSTKEEKNILEKLVRNTTEYSQHALIVLTGFEGATIPAVIIQRDEIGTVCDDKCDLGKWYGVAALFLFALSLIALAWSRLRSVIQQEKDFYDLCLIWFGVSFIIFLPLAYGVAPRFYLLVTPLFFVLLGILLKAAATKIRGQAGIFLFASVTLLLVTSNVYFLYNRFSELARAKTETVLSRPDRILKEQIRVTLEQQQTIVSFLKQQQMETGYPIYMHSDPQYRRALKYVMDKEGVQNDVLSLSSVYQQGKYYLILRQRGDYEPSIRKYRENYDIGEYRQFGTLTVIELVPKPEKVTAERQEFGKPEKDTTTPASAPRYTWREFFQKNGESLEDDSEQGEGQDN